jgi:molybdopterin-guanine dinucleotide biosynthesis protein A
MALGREAPGEPLRPQPLASLIHVRHRAGLAAALDAGERRVEGWLRSLPLARVAFDRPADECAFANINNRSELERLERLDRG